MTDIVVAVIAVLAGVLMCFEGYKLFRLSLGIAGGVAGFILGKIIISMTSNMGMSWNYISKSVVLLLFTVGLGILAFTLYMKALIAITTIVCAFWFYDDFSFLFAKIEGNGNGMMSVILTKWLGGPVDLSDVPQTDGAKTA